MPPDGSGQGRGENAEPVVCGAGLRHEASTIGGGQRRKRSHALAALLFLAALAAAFRPSAAETGASPEEVLALQAEVVELYQQGRYADAISLATRALASAEGTLGPEHPYVATALNDLASLYQATGDYARAQPLYERSLSIREKALGPEHPDVARVLYDLAGLYQTTGDYARAQPLYERSLSIREKALGPEHPDVARSLGMLAALYQATGDFARALPLFERSLAISERALGPEHLDVAAGLGNLAGFYQATGDSARAAPLYERSLAIQEKALGPEHPNVASGLNNLAFFYQATGHYSQAQPLYERSLAIREKALGPEHPDVARTLGSLASLYHDSGDYARALPLYERSLAIREKALGPEHPAAARTLGNLAWLYQDMGDFARAQPLYERSLAIQEKALGPEHPDVALSLLTLASLYQETGDSARAQPLYERSLAIREKALGPEHPDVAATLRYLASLYQDTADYARALPLYERSLAIQEKALGPEHPSVAATLSHLASLYQDTGDSARAQPLYQRSLAIAEKALGPEHPSVAASLNNLAALYRAAGDYVRAAPLFERSLAIFERALGPEHPDVATSLNNLGTLRWAQGEFDEAMRLFERAAEIEERQRSAILTMGSERQAQAYLETSDFARHASLSLGRVRPKDGRAIRLALTSILRTKGRVLETAAGGMEALRRAVAPEDRGLLDELLARRAQLAQVELRGPGAVPPERYRELVGSLRKEVEELERQALRRGGALRVAAELVRLEAVQAQIPADAALVEIVAYRTFRPAPAKGESPWGEERLAGFVLRREGEPHYADLGPLEEANARALALREALQGLGIPAEEHRSRARALYQTVLAPLASSLQGVDHLLIAPDGALHLVPFAALENGEGRLLVEQLRITYLTSGRDLLRLGLGGRSREGPLLVAAPDFDGAGASSEKPAPAQVAAVPRRSRDFAGMRFQPLPGTRDEATALAKLLGVTALMGAKAREAALKRARGPRVLHLATHGFFLADQKESPPEPVGLETSLPPRPPATESALLRSGLALAGANRLADGEDDGILTALELAGLDLTGTQLLVLSACETGVGDVKQGEGVYGLRRAALLAGAEAQLVSLWKVADEATRELMEAYYRRLLAGEGRSEALRQVQLEMLRNPALSHPFYWASFVPIGAWGPLEFREKESKPPGSAGAGR